MGAPVKPARSPLPHRKWTVMRLLPDKVRRQHCPLTLVPSTRAVVGSQLAHSVRPEHRTADPAAMATCHSLPPTTNTGKWTPNWSNARGEGSSASFPGGSPGMGSLRNEDTAEPSLWAKAGGMSQGCALWSWSQPPSPLIGLWHL